MRWSPPTRRPATTASPSCAIPCDRRFRYPFVNCTNCGPRFTIVRGVPYDRPATTMAGFAMCPACQAEYDDPGDRRFHAQPNACPVCGPRARLLDRDGTPSPARAPETTPCRRRRAGWRTGRCSRSRASAATTWPAPPRNEQAVRELRARKRREDRPFALMARDVRGGRGARRARRRRARRCSCRPPRPIVLAPRRAGRRRRRRRGAGCPRARRDAARTRRSITCCWPTSRRSAPARSCSRAATSPTSRSRSATTTRASASAASPTARSPTTARSRRARTTRWCARSPCGGDRRPLMLRRSRGYVPASIDLPLAAPRPLLACGAQLKATFCLARGRRAWVSHHIGDLEHYPALARLPAGHRALRAPVRAHAGAHRARPAPRLRLDGARARARRRGR